MTDRELSVADWNERAARALGWRQIKGHWIDPACPPNIGALLLSNFHNDPATLPVLLAAIAARGWTLGTVTEGQCTTVDIIQRPSRLSGATASTLQAAVCEAFVLAMEGGAK